jgi:hypothetical protein
MAVNCGAPSVTMISAGTVDTKIWGTSAMLSWRPGICWRTSAKLRSFGSPEKAGGSVPAGVQCPSTLLARSQAPLFSQYQVCVSPSKKMLQLVLTA